MTKVLYDTCFAYPQARINFESLPPNKTSIQGTPGERYKLTFDLTLHFNLMFCSRNCNLYYEFNAGWEFLHDWLVKTVWKYI